METKEKEKLTVQKVEEIRSEEPENKKTLVISYCK